MRKVTAQIKEAFERRQSKKVGNTRTDGTTVWLHGNPIIQRQPNGMVHWTLAGWNTPTTRERLNGIVDAGVHQVNFEAMQNGVPISSQDWFVA